MGFKRGQAPADLDAEGLRKFTEDQLLRIQRATLDMDTSTTESLAAIEADIVALQTSVAANTTNITSLQSDMTKVRYAQMAKVALTGAAQTGLADATKTKINFNSVIFDPSSIWDNTNKWFKPTVAGYYRFSWQCYLRNNAASVLLAISQFNGSDLSYATYNPGVSEAMVHGSDLTHFNGTTDNLYIAAYISGGSARLVDAGSTVTYFSIELMRAD